MAKDFKPLNEDLAIRFLTYYHKVLLDQKDTRRNQILSPEQADAIISLWDAGDIKAHYTEDAVVIGVYADVATRPYRTYYPEDIENFRNEYLQALELEAQPWQKDTIDYLRSQMESFDSRYPDAESDISCHTRFDDYPYGWVFEDERFALMDCNDTEYLRFICEMFHPEVRSQYEIEVSTAYYKYINSLIKRDGYELYAKEYISGCAIYSYRSLSEVELRSNTFMPFSIRHNQDIVAGRIKFSIPKKTRAEILGVINRHSRYENFVVDGYSYQDTTSNNLFNELKALYDVQSYDENGIKVQSKCLEQVIMASSPYKVFDAIELYSFYPDNESFVAEINITLSQLGWSIKDNKLMQISLHEANLTKPYYEETLKDILKMSEDLFNSNSEDDQQLGLEKLWDALERVKSYFHPIKNKKESIEEIIRLISCGNEKFVKEITAEFTYLTDIGNGFSIRHFERQQNQFPSIHLKRYFFFRCSALINLAINVINSHENKS